jgi:hypothetical protein
MIIKKILVGLFLKYNDYPLYLFLLIIHYFVQNKRISTNYEEIQTLFLFRMLTSAEFCQTVGGGASMLHTSLELKFD